jgi:trans-aconitate methyltransferase
MKSINWKLIWDNKAANSSDLMDLIIANGYDHHTKIDKENYSNFLNHVLKKLGASKNESIFEVGCGAGAALRIFKEYGMMVGGIDQSESLLESTRTLDISNDLILGDAYELSQFPQYDYVVSMSVFQYFPDLSYVADITNKMLLKSKSKKIAILDINDIDKKIDFLNYKKSTIENYEKKYKGLDQLYIDKQFWIELCNAFNCKVEIEPCIIKDYVNAPFKYNVYVSQL